MSLPQPGLSQAEAERLLKAHGPNDLRPRRRLAWLRHFFEVLSEPTLLVLVVVAGLYAFLGSRDEALLLGAFVALVLAITLFEEGRTAGTLEALAQYASPRVMVMRGGEWQRRSGLDLVPGDHVKLSEGDRVPADVLIHESNDLRVDESILTGESLGAWKSASPDSPVEERTLYAGTLVLQGQALASVARTGLATRMGAAAKSLASVQSDPTPFQRSAVALVRMLALIAAAACALVVLLAWLRGAPVTRALMQGLVLAIATVPEELPVVLAVFLAMAARRLSKKGILVRRVPAVETLGALTLLAVDKTGTLTRNEMRLAAVLPDEAVPEGELVAAAARACEIEPFDPMEKAILERAGAPQGAIVHEYSLGGRPPRMGHVWDGGRLAVKGALEGVLGHCDLAPGRAAALLEQARLLSGRGLRVLGVAEGAVAGAPPPEIPGGLRFLGLLGFEDPLREGTQEAVAQAHRAGIRVVMLTGDSPETAAAIAAQAGLDTGPGVVEGSQLESQPARLDGWAAKVNVFARAAPEHKLLLIDAWSRSGEVVGMTGDGVNDAPALTRAHVGIAMGRRGVDVAREASQLVLLDDSFTALLQGVRVGRDTTRRILKAAAFILAVHVPIVGAVLACLVLGWPPLLEAAQVAFLELFIGPACSVVFERTRDRHDPLLLPPRDPRAPLLAWRAAGGALLKGAAILGVVLWIYAAGLDGPAGDQAARSQAFLALLLADFFLCWTLLSREPFWKAARWNNPAFYLVCAGVLGLLLGLLSWQRSAHVFHMAPPSTGQWLLALAAALAALGWVELLKLVPRRRA